MPGGGNIYNAEPAVAEYDAAIVALPQTAIVGTAMSDAVAHRQSQRTIAR